MAKLALESVSKQFPDDGTFAVKSICLEVKDKEFLVLVGPSGCGKSTTLRMIAGLEQPSSGTIKIDDQVVDDKPPNDRNIAMVFQNYALYPHMTVYGNLSFGLLLRYGGGVLNRGLIRIFQPRESARLTELRNGVDHQVRQAAKKLGISHLLDKKPYQLSGGERQRVALGRAIVRDPAVFLFDEPLSNLDAKLRQQMRRELKQLHRELSATIVYVTHDQVEAMTMGDRIVVMKDGEILQIGSPEELYHRPANTFVAQFIGSVPTNLMLDPDHEETSTTHPETICGFRAEHGRLSSWDARPNNETGNAIRLAATVRNIDRLGDSTLVSLEANVTRTQPNQEISLPTNETVTLDNPHPIDGNDAERWALPEVALNNNARPDFELSDLGGSVIVTVRTQGDCSWQRGQRVVVEVDRENLMWFDAASGHNLNRENS